LARASWAAKLRVMVTNSGSLRDVGRDPSRFNAMLLTATRSPLSLLAPVDVRIDVWITVVHVGIDVTIVDMGITGIVRPIGGAADPSVYTGYSVLSMGSVKRQRKHCIGRPM